MPRGLSRVALQEDEPLAQYLKMSRHDAPNQPRSVARYAYSSNQNDDSEDMAPPPTAVPTLTPYMGTRRITRNVAGVAPKSTLDIIQEYGRVMRRKRRFGNTNPGLRLGVTSDASADNFDYFYGGDGQSG